MWGFDWPGFGLGPTSVSWMETFFLLFLNKDGKEQGWINKDSRDDGDGVDDDDDTIIIHYTRLTHSDMFSLTLFFCFLFLLKKFKRCSL